MPDLDPVQPRFVICIAEDRRSCESALKLLLMSLYQFNPAVPVVVYYPPANPDFLGWADKIGFKSLSIRAERIPGTYAWNVKPQALLEMLNEVNGRVIWIDSDILTTKSILPVFENLNQEVLVCAEEALLGHNETNASRARMWRLPVARSFDFPLNTCVVAVTHDHIPLLKRWKDLLQSVEYKEAQSRPLSQRPIHMFGDQDVLTALLCSREFCNIPLRILRRGRDIVQWYEQDGFTIAERLLCFFRGMPLFIHQQGWKPWLHDSEEKLVGLRGTIISAYQDLSPYSMIAVRLEPSLATSWARPRSKLASISRKLACGSVPLVGLPIAAIFDLVRLTKLPRTFVKTFLDRFYPNALLTYRSRRWAKEMRKHFRETFLARQNRMKARIYGEQKPRVLLGPFAGMTYLNEIVWGPIEPKWLGTYEQELHPIIESILDANYSTIIDIGSAEGYYAVGLANKLPKAHVHSFDIDPWARRQQRKLAKLNNVKNVEIRQQCKPQDFEINTEGRALIVCDIEGSEYELLDPEKTPVLRKYDMLVEMHDHPESGFTSQIGAEEMVRRFSISHRVTTIHAKTRGSTSLYPGLLPMLSADELIECMDERRSPDQIWLWLESRDQATTKL